MIKRNGVILWIQYFDKSLKRSDGRRVSLNKAIKNPTQEMIITAAKSLGWGAEPYNKSHPKQWWRRGAAVIIYPPQRLRKSEIISKLADRLRI